MKKRKKKNKIPKERDVFVPLMLLNCKPGAHPDKKKEASRRVCRAMVRPESENAFRFCFFRPESPCVASLGGI